MTISVEITTAGICKIGFIQKQTNKIQIICNIVSTNSKMKKLQGPNDGSTTSQLLIDMPDVSSTVC